MNVATSLPRAATWPAGEFQSNTSRQLSRSSLPGTPSQTITERVRSPSEQPQPQPAPQEPEPEQTALEEPEETQPLSTSAALHSPPLSPVENSHTFHAQAPTDEKRFSPLTALRWWMPEILASLLSVATLIAIVTVLRVYDGHPLDGLNLPQSLSLNGLVAVLATLHRIFLAVPLGSSISQEGWLHFAKKTRCRRYLRDIARFDNASKGAWGSLLFLFTNPRQYLTLLAAVTTVVSLGISTFVQQLITFTSIPLNDLQSPLQPGNIARSETYNNYLGAPGEEQLRPSLAIAAAIYNGMMTQNLVPVDSHCPTGNCTWPMTPSLAICGDCAPIRPIRTQCFGLTYVCNYTMPSGTVFSLNDFKGSTLGIGWQVFNSKGQHWNTSVNGRIYVMNFDAMGAIYGSYAREGVADHYTATECALWFCVNKYNITMQDGTQIQRRVSSFADAGNYGLDSSLSDTQFSINYPNSMAGFSDGSFTPYNVSGFAIEALQDGFKEIIVGGYAELNDRGYGVTGGPAVEAIWAGSGDFKSWIENLALSMTNAVRIWSPTPREEFAGRAYVQGVRIRWAWITLPAVTLVASLILLVTTMVRTARSEVSPWKGSPLVFLFCEVDDDIRREIDETDWFHEVSGRHRVGKQRAALRKSEKGRWIFELAND